MKVEGIIPSFVSFFDDLNYHGDVVRCMQRLVPRSMKISTVTNFLDHFDARRLSEQELAIQTSEAVFEIKSGDEMSQFLVGYLQLYTYAARFYDKIPDQPTRSNTKVRAGSTVDAATLHRFAQLAARMGFDSPQISACLRLTDGPGLAAEAGAPGSPALVVGGPGEPFKRRSGKPLKQNYQLDKHFFFLGHLIDQSRKRGEGISSFFVLKSRFHAFFWKSLQYVRNHASGPWQVPADDQARNVCPGASVWNDVNAAHFDRVMGPRRVGVVDPDADDIRIANDAEKEVSGTGQNSRISASIRDAALVADAECVQAVDKKSAEARRESHREATHDEPMSDVNSTLPRQRCEEVPDTRLDGDENARIEGDKSGAERCSDANMECLGDLHANSESASGLATRRGVPDHRLQPPEDAEHEIGVGATEASLLRNGQGDEDRQNQTETAPPPWVRSIENEPMSEPSSPVEFEDPSKEPYRSTDIAHEAPLAPFAQAINAASDTPMLDLSKHERNSRGAIEQGMTIGAPDLRHIGFGVDGAAQQRHGGPETRHPHVEGLVSQPPPEQQTAQLHEHEKESFDAQNIVSPPSSVYSSQDPGPPPGDIQSVYLQPQSAQPIQQREPLDEDNCRHSALWRYIAQSPEGHNSDVHGDIHVPAPHEQDGSWFQAPVENNLGSKAPSRLPSPQHSRPASKIHQGASSGHVPMSLTAHFSPPKRASPGPKIRHDCHIKFLIQSEDMQSWVLFDEILDEDNAEVQMERFLQEQIRRGRFAVINGRGGMRSVGPRDCYRALRESATASVVLLDARNLKNVDDQLREPLESVQRKRKSIMEWPTRQRQKIHRG